MELAYACGAGGASNDLLHHDSGKRAAHIGTHDNETRGSRDLTAADAEGGTVVRESVCECDAGRAAL